jgi:hypothetical protein
MKKIIENRILLLCCLLVTLFLVACEDDEMNAPVITGIRNYAPSPDDSVLQSLQPGQWVVLTGQNLSGAVQILFNGVPTSVNSAMFSDTYAAVQVPAIIPFPIIPAEQLNTITYITERGSTTFSFNIVAPAPTITAISNENASPGDSVYIYGTNLFLLTKIIYAGVEITEYSSASTGTYVGFVLPELDGSGTVTVENETGAYTTGYTVNDPTGLLCDFDAVNPFSWGTSTENNGTDFSGNKGYYAVLKNTGLSADSYDWWGWQRSINTNAVQWVPVDSLSVPIEEYAFKFEINVPEDWTGTALYILKDYTWTYVARYEPWKVTTPHTTNGWRTVTIPFTSFRTQDGKGASAANLTQVLGATANGSINIYTINDAKTPAAPLNIGIDNIRVVKMW